MISRTAKKATLLIIYSRAGKIRFLLQDFWNLSKLWNSGFLKFFLAIQEIRCYKIYAYKNNVSQQIRGEENLIHEVNQDTSVTLIASV